MDDAITLARMLKEHGLDILDVSTGQTTPAAEPEYGRMYQAPFANLIRHAAGIPTITVGAVQGWDHVNTLVASGRADLCALARPHLADPYLTLHAAAEQGFDVPWPSPYLPGKPRAQ
jgi:anthraniloyl-CoA monooxygenase